MYILFWKRKHFILTLASVGFVLSCLAQTSEIDRLKEELQLIENDSLRIITHIQLSHELSGIKPEEALIHANNALDLSRDVKQDVGIAESYKSIARIYHHQGKYLEALDFFSKSLRIYEQLSDKFRIAELQNNIGLVHFSQGKFDDAFKNCQNSLEILSEYDEGLEIAETYSTIGKIYFRRGEYPEALEYHFKGLAIFEELSDSMGMANSFRNIGVVQRYQRSFDKALEYYTKSLELRKMLGDKRGVAGSYINIGIIYENLEQYKMALEFSEEGVKVLEELGDKMALGSSYLNIGNIYYSLSDFESARAYYVKGLNIVESLSSIQYLGVFYTNIAYTFQEEGRYEKAILFAEKGLENSREIGSKQEIKDSYFFIAELYASIGNNNKAYEYMYKHGALADTVYNETTSRQIAEMQTKYETEKKEQQIELLEKDATIKQTKLENEKILRYAGIGFTALVLVIGGLFFNRYKLQQENTQIQLEKSKTQTENQLLRSQMNPHFIFNSLNAIQSFISSNQASIGEEYLADFAKLMRAILENSAREFVSLTNEIETLEIYIKLEQLRFEDRFEYKIELDPELEIDLISIPPMLIQPFVENAIVHGLANKNDLGQLTISFEDHQETIVCKVQDDGIGRQAAAQLKKTKSHQSMGIDVTENRIENLSEELNVEGSVVIEDLTDENGQASGTSAKIIIPIAQD